MVTLNFKEYSLDIPSRVYIPSEDTDLLLNVLEEEIIKRNKTFKKAIEIGTGNAFLSLEIYDNVNQLYSTDINPIVIDYLLNVKDKYNLEKMKVVYSNLFDSIDDNEKFDLIVFNPPYVPTEDLEKEDDSINGYDLAVNGGVEGREIIDKFISQLPNHLEKEGICYLLVSSLNNPIEIIENLKKQNLKTEIKKAKKLFFEELLILKITW
jgi:release factor glutamine methyltransferase